MSERKDPYHVYRFLVEVEQVQAGGFTHVAGLERNTTTDDYREGGVNEHVRKLAGVTKYPNLVLKRGLADRLEFWAWHQLVIDGFVMRRNVSVVLRDARGSELRRWMLEGAFPVKWNGSDLDASAHTVAVEAVELAHHGLRVLG